MATDTDTDTGTGTCTGTGTDTDTGTGTDAQQNAAAHMHTMPSHTTTFGTVKHVCRGADAQICYTRAQVNRELWESCCIVIHSQAQANALGKLSRTNGQVNET